MRLPTLRAVLSLTLLYLLKPVVADTEIRNFRLPLEGSVLSYDGSQPLIQLDSSARQLTLNVSSSRPELSIRLDPAEAYDSWTVRLSWPGSSPTKFELSLHPLLSHSANNRSAVLHISAQPLSIPIPIYPIRLPILYHLSTLLYPAISDKPPTVEQPDGEWLTTFHLVLEPLILVVLPRTAIPAIWLILLFGTGAACCVPSMIRTLEGVQQLDQLDQRKAQ